MLLIQLLHNGLSKRVPQREITVCYSEKGWVKRAIAMAITSGSYKDSNVPYHIAGRLYEKCLELLAGPPIVRSGQDIPSILTQ